MDVKVIHNGLCIGTAFLDKFDPTMCIAGGNFVPNASYDCLGNLLQKYFDAGFSPELFSVQDIEELEAQVFKLRYEVRTIDDRIIRMADNGTYIQDASHKLRLKAREIWVFFRDAAEFDRHLRWSY